MARPPVLLWLALMATCCGRSGFERIVTGDSELQAVPTENDPEALVQVAAITASWATPQWVLWQWNTSGLVGDLAVIEMVIAESMQDLVERRASARTLRFPRSAIGLPDDATLDQLNGLLSDEHVPDRDYWSQLTAIDLNGRISATNVARVHTQAPPSVEVVIFQDDPTPGYSIPSDFALSSQAPYRGTHCYAWQVGCGSATCYDILRRQSVDVDLSTLDAQSFADTAYFEFAAASDSVPASPGTRLRVWFGTASDHDGMLYAYGGWPMRADGEYRLYQVPMRMLMSVSGAGDVPLPYDIAVRGIYEFGVDGTWSTGSTTRLDEWRVYW